VDDAPSSNADVTSPSRPSPEWQNSFADSRRWARIGAEARLAAPEEEQVLTLVSVAARLIPVYRRINPVLALRHE